MQPVPRSTQHCKAVDADGRSGAREAALPSADLQQNSLWMHAPREVLDLVRSGAQSLLPAYLLCLSPLTHV